MKGLCGFANTLVFTGIMSFGLSNRDISPVELLLGYPTNVLIAFRERRSIDWRLCLPMAAMVVAGSVPGMLLLKSADVRAVKLLFGVVIVAVGMEMLLRAHGNRPAKESRLALGVIGLLSGVLCGLYGVGALLGAYVGRVAKDSSAFRANLCVVFFIENTMRIIFYSASGILTMGMLWQALRLAPWMAAGLYLGVRCRELLDEARAKKLVIVMLIVSGLALIAAQI